MVDVSVLVVASVQYSMNESISEVVNYLRLRSPESAQRAEQHYSILEHFGDDAGEYGLALAYGLVDSQKRAVISVMQDLQQRGGEYVAQQGLADGDELVYCKLNAKLV